MATLWLMASNPSINSNGRQPASQTLMAGKTWSLFLWFLFLLVAQLGPTLFDCTSLLQGRENYLWRRATFRRLPCPPTPQICTFSTPYDL